MNKCPLGSGDRLTEDGAGGGLLGGTCERERREPRAETGRRGGGGCSEQQGDRVL